MSKNAPRDARDLVGKGDGEHVVMQPLLGGLVPRPEPVAFMSPVPIAATMALKMIGPMPGTLIRRSHPASRLASSSIALDKPSMRSSSRCQLEAINDTHHGGKRIGRCGQDAR